MVKFLESLKLIGFFIDDLILVDNGQYRKYFGVCKFFGENIKYRRLDIIVVFYNEWVCFLLYFIGFDYFNRLMRFLVKKNGMFLLEYFLN